MSVRMTAPQLAPLHEWTLEYVKNLPVTEIEWLDFKESRWLTTEEKTFNSLSHYVSAFANYGGGYLVIGFKDPVPGKPLEFDGGVDFSIKNGIQNWLEDKIPSLVDPPISRISVQPIPLATGDSFGVVVIRIEPSDDAPHQARDKIFYQRVGTKNRGLGTQHVMDIRNRQRHADITVRLTLTVFEHDDKDDPQGNLMWEVMNPSNVFCRHIAVVIKAPLLLNGRALAYEDSHVREDKDDPSVSYFHLSAGNGLSPLFPKATLSGRFQVKLMSGPWQPPKKTCDSFSVRAYADGAPPKEFTILQSEVATVHFHPRSY